MPRKWRLFLDGAASGPWNMGVDEALLAAASTGGTPALRFYRWDGPWLSLGYGQSLPPFRREACAAAGVGLVRRVTGGRAVLHGGDLTYAVAAPETCFPAGLRPSYELVSAALRSALLELGIDASPAPGPAPGGRTGRGAFDCFAEAAGDELCVGARKLVGSAQRRARGGVLQHGSIRVRADAAAVREAAGLDPDSATSLGELGFGHDYAVLTSACLRAFAKALDARFEDSALSENERRSAGTRSVPELADPRETAGPPRGTSREPLDGR